MEQENEKQDTAANPIVEDHSNSNDQVSAFSGFFRVFRYGSPSDYVLELLGILAAIGSGIALALVNIVLGDFINLLIEVTSGDSIPDDFMSRVSSAALRFVYIGIARFVFTYIYASLFTYVAYHLTRNIRHSYLRAALSQEIAFFDGGHSGSVSMQATSNGKLIQAGITEKLGLCVQATSTFAAAFVIAFISQWKLTLITLCIIPAIFLTIVAASTVDAGIETSILKIYGQAGSYAENVLAGIRTVHAFRLWDHVGVKYEDFLDRAYKRGMRKNMIYGVLFGAEFFIVNSGIGLAFWQGIKMMGRGEIAEIGTVFTVVFSIIVAATMIASIAPHTIAFSRAATAAAELFTLIDRKSQLDPFDEQGERPSVVEGSIDMRGVTFCYPSRPEVTVLREFSLHIPAGKVTALVGPSGSGKSTIIGLLERWYSSTSGSIRLDGTELDQLNLKWLRTNIRLVQQEPVLFNTTVFENIANGLVGTEWEDCSTQEKVRRVESAAKLAFAHDFILELPQKYDTRIGERGGLLSGGQKQRIAIARSVISEPKILLLDEATSALDPKAEGIVQQALDNASQNRTTITIAHKLSTIRNADNIVVMSTGGIAEQGTHAELVSSGGLYSSLVHAQDLSAAPESTADESSSDEDAVEETKLGLRQSLSKVHTKDVEHLELLKDREDYDLHKPMGLMRSVTRLIMKTPELAIWYIVSFGTSAIGGAIFPAQAILLGNVLDVTNSPNMVSRGSFYALMFFIMAIASLIVYFVMGWATNIIAQSLNRRVRKEMLSSVIKQDLRFFDRPENTVGAIISRIDSYPQAILELMGMNMGMVFLSGAMVLISAILALAVTWRVGVVGVFVGLPPLLLAGYARIRLEAKIESDMGKGLAASSSLASETVNAIRTVSSLAIEQRVLNLYGDELDTAISKSAPRMFFMMIWFALTQSIEYFILALGFWWGAKLIGEGKVSFYEFTVSFMAIYFCGQGAGQMFSFSSSFTKANQAVNHYFWLLGLQPTIRETDENRDVAPQNGCSSYDLQNIKFAYPLAPNNTVLKGVSLNIRPGEFVAFVGASGCGKSTMISLLERFYDPASGSIVIDSAQSLSEMNPHHYRKHVALVQQEPTLFPGSIRENIANGIDNPAGERSHDEEIEAACRAANAWDFVSSLPEGLETPCGTSGSQLSGGQRQRIAIARALVRNPNVILLDEATSALDTESERVVQGALMTAAKAGDRITIAVAHRLSTIRDANRIFVFYQGRIAEVGTHNELLQQGGMYTKMCEAQRLGV
ncbi:unnamed protein product [Clonostachys solani]|uniref:Leptomycin B resistance protein pmd1 n=1 Tax=Clonostachys solani TaxID=160281 RepID=A0A9N9W7A9_9HYPO|nr:unnamed protein product [Clonostachys solani]